MSQIASLRYRWTLLVIIVRHLIMHFRVVCCIVALAPQLHAAGASSASPVTRSRPRRGLGRGRERVGVDVPRSQDVPCAELVAASTLPHSGTCTPRCAAGHRPNVSEPLLCEGGELTPRGAARGAVRLIPCARRRHPSEVQLVVSSRSLVLRVHIRSTSRQRLPSFGATSSAHELTSSGPGGPVG